MLWTEVGDGVPGAGDLAASDGVDGRVAVVFCGAGDAVADICGPKRDALVATLAVTVRALAQ